MSNLLMRYIRLAVREEHSARVPNQLVSADSGNEGDENVEQELDEFCGVGGGGIVGYNASLGAGNPHKQKKRRK